MVSGGLESVGTFVPMLALRTEYFGGRYSGSHALSMVGH